MEPELLLCDIGNTTLKMGVADSKKVLTSYSFPVINEMTSDSLGISIASSLRHAGIDPSSIHACVVSSVVPRIDPLLRDAVSRFVGCQTYFVPREVPVPLENRYVRPEEVGADILVGAYAARILYPAVPSLVVVDFGTAATFACVNEHAFLGGLIFPGPATAATALASHTAKLPNVSLDIRAAEPAPGTDTVTSIQHGLVFGFVYATEGLCNRLKRQLPAPVKIIAAGGFASTIARVSSVFDAVVPSLILDGLRELYYRDKNH